MGDENLIIHASKCIYFISKNVDVFLVVFFYMPFLSCSRHIWELPILCYHRIGVNYSYPFLGVKFSVILHDFLQQNYHKNQSNCYHFPLIMINYPIFSLNDHILCFQKIVQNFLFSKQTP